MLIHTEVASTYRYMDGRTFCVVIKLHLKTIGFSSLDVSSHFVVLWQTFIKDCALPFLLLDLRGDEGGVVDEVPESDSDMKGRPDIWWGLWWLLNTSENIEKHTQSG